MKLISFGILVTANLLVVKESLLDSVEMHMKVVLRRIENSRSMGEIQNGVTRTV